MAKPNMELPMGDLEFTGKRASDAMIEGLVSTIRTELRKRILERIEPDIQAAINGSLESFKVAIESYRDYANMRYTVSVLIERRDISVNAKERG